MNKQILFFDPSHNELSINVTEQGNLLLCVNDEPFVFLNIEEATEVWNEIFKMIQDIKKPENDQA